MLYKIYSYHIDLIIFYVSAGILILSLYVWLRRRIKDYQIPSSAVSINIFFLCLAYVLFNQNVESTKAHLKQMVSDMAPTYAQELQLMGHEKINLQTPPDDPLYLSLIDAEKRWLEVNQTITRNKKPLERRLN